MASGGEWKQVRLPDGSSTWEWTDGQPPVPPPPHVPGGDDIPLTIPPPPHVPVGHEVPLAGADVPVAIPPPQVLPAVEVRRVATDVAIPPPYVNSGHALPVGFPPVAPGPEFVVPLSEPDYASIDFGPLRRERRRRRVKVLVAVAGAAALVAGVTAFAMAGDDGPSKADLAAITQTANDVVLGTDSQRICSALLSPSLVTTVFHDEATCRASGADDQAQPLPTGATVTELRIEGRTASATVAQVGGPEAGAGGRWSFARTGKHDWQVTEWSPEYVRSEFRQLLGPQYHVSGTGDGLADPTIRSCVSGKLQGLADPAFLDVAYDIFRQGTSGKQQLRTFYYDCATVIGPDGTSPLRRIFEDGIRNSNQLPDSLEDCMTLRLRDLVPDSALRSMFEQDQGDGAVPPEIRAQVVAATIQCARQETGH